MPAPRPTSISILTLSAGTGQSNVIDATYSRIIGLRYHSVSDYQPGLFFYISHNGVDYSALGDPSAFPGPRGSAVWYGLQRDLFPSDVFVKLSTTGSDVVTEDIIIDLIISPF